jgi:hypothetical protein
MPDKLTQYMECAVCQGTGVLNADSRGHDHCEACGTTGRVPVLTNKLTPEELGKICRLDIRGHIAALEAQLAESQKAVEEARRRRLLVEADLKEWQEYWGCEYPHDSHVATNGVLGREQERANLACNEVASLKAELANAQKDSERLRSSLDDAPHDEDCAYIGSILNSLDKKRVRVGCSCWKSRTSVAIKAAVLDAARKEG